MKRFSPRFAVPVDLARPRGARLLEAFSPKLGRTLRHFDRAAFEYWVGLEADPDVEVFCERPVQFPAGGGDSTADFWVLGREGEAILLLGSRDAAVVPSEVDDIPVRVVAAAEIAAARTWIGNWQRMLPVIVAARGSVAPGLTKSILRFVTKPTPLAHIEGEFSVGDPSLARATAFELLRVGRLRAPSLRTESLSSLTRLEPNQ